MANPAERGLAAKTQIDWVSCSTDGEALKEHLYKAIVTARRSFADLAEPCEGQRAAKAWLDQIARGLESAFDGSPFLGEIQGPALFPANADPRRSGS
jgi:hypothetical protein